MLRITSLLHLAISVFVGLLLLLLAEASMELAGRNSEDDSFVKNNPYLLFLYVVSFFVAGGLWLLLRKLTQQSQAFVLLKQQFDDARQQVADTEATLGEQLQLTALNQKELLKSNYELQSLNRKLEAAKDQAHLSERLINLGEVSAGIIHEINNPVAYVSSNLSELDTDLKSLLAFVAVLDKASDSLDVNSEFYLQLLSAFQELGIQQVLADAPERLNDSLQGIERVRKIIQDMKRLSSRGDQDKKYCDLNVDIHSVINIASSRLKHGVSLTTTFTELPDVFCNASQIAQVVTNLIVNAIQAFEDNPGDIHFSEYVEGDYIVLQVSDNGPGMDATTAERAFDPFFTTKDADQGTGIGLSLCYKLIKEHHGRIDLITAPGKGACFTIYLPLNHDGENDAQST